MKNINDYYYTEVGKLGIYHQLKDLIFEMLDLKSDISDLDDEEIQEISDDFINKAKKIIVNCEKLIKQNISHEGMVEKIKDYATTLLSSAKNKKSFVNYIKKADKYI